MLYQKARWIGLSLAVLALLVISGCIRERSSHPLEEPTTDAKGELVATLYKVEILYTTSAAQDNFGEVSALLRTYDQNLQYFPQEIFPRIDIVFLRTDIANLCPTIEGVLEERIYVQKVTCQRWQALPPVENPEQPHGPKQ